MERHDAFSPLERARMLLNDAPLAFESALSPPEGALPLRDVALSRRPGPLCDHCF
jgi:hypothetical protein